MNKSKVQKGERVPLFAKILRFNGGEAVAEVPPEALNEAVSTRDKADEARVKARSADFDKKLEGVRERMTEKKPKKKGKGGILVTIRNIAIGAGALFYIYLFLMYGPIVLGCTLALVIMGGIGVLIYRSRPKDDADEE